MGRDCKGVVVQNVAYVCLPLCADERTDEALQHENAVLGAYVGNNVSREDKSTTVPRLDALFRQALRTSLDVNLRVDGTDDPNCCCSASTIVTSKASSLSEPMLAVDTVASPPAAGSPRCSSSTSVFPSPPFSAVSSSSTRCRSPAAVSPSVPVVPFVTSRCTARAAKSPSAPFSFSSSARCSSSAVMSSLPSATSTCSPGSFCWASAATGWLCSI
mmetsp:Transcript_3249/g.10766  ORF Transcript_3249/g.10766 Transcript_3249/m.10766 type:complete len:216 (-) Transcript_3249:53-700(-)